MKRFLILLPAILICLAAEAQPGRLEEYRIDRMKGQVYFGRDIVHGADARTFKDLGFGYGKDSRNVYRFGEVLEFVDPSSFRVDRRFARRPEHGFNQGNGNRPEHPGMNPGNGHGPGRPEMKPDYGRELSGGYHVTQFDVFYDGQKLQGAYANSFIVMDDGYAKDSFNVWWCGCRIEEAYSNSFEVLKFGYAKDSFNVWWCGRKLESVFPGNFSVDSNGYATDSFHTYFEGRRID